MSTIIKMTFLSLLVAITLSPLITEADIRILPFTPTIHVAVKPSVRGYKPFSESQITNMTLIATAFPDAPIMSKIARAESTYIETNKNPNSTAKGLFQILDSTWKDNHCIGNVFNAADNIACAKILYTASGTSSWNASKSTWSHYQ